MIVGRIGSGVTMDDLLADDPYLERDDILQALRYAAWRSEEREIVLASFPRATPWVGISRAFSPL